MTRNQKVAVIAFFILVFLMSVNTNTPDHSLSQASSTNGILEQTQTGLFVTSDCIKRLAGQNVTKCIDEDKRFLCNKSPATYLSLGRIKYCVSYSNQRFSIQKTLTVAYSNSNRYFTNEEMQTKVSSAMTEMRHLYAEYDIDLNINFQRTNLNANPDVIFQDNLNADPYMFRIPMMIKERKLTDEQFALLFSHELSHHLGLPDRYESSSCPLRKVATDSLMGHKHQSGNAGMMLSADDQQLLLDPVCSPKPQAKSWFFRR